MSSSFPLLIVHIFGRGDATADHRFGKVRHVFQKSQVKVERISDRFKSAVRTLIWPWSNSRPVVAYTDHWETCAL
jgi:hypothetical protein